MPIIADPAPGLGQAPIDVTTQGWLGQSGIILADGSLTDDQGCRWKFNPTNAWGPKPSPREDTGDLDYAHGQWDATRYYGARVIPIPGSVRAPSHAALHAAEQRLRNAVTVEPFTYRVLEPGFDASARVRQQGAIDWTEDGTPSAPHATFLITLYAPDPLIYDSDVEEFSLQFPTSSGGLTWPATWPLMWNTVQVTGSRLLSNTGAVPVGLDLRVTGPATTVQIAFPETRMALNLANPNGPLLTAGQWLDVDTKNRQVLLNGDADRRGWAYRDFLLLPPGNTTLAIAGTGTTTDSGVSGTFRAARL